MSRLRWLRLGCSFGLLACSACTAEKIQNLGGQQCTYKQVIPCTGEEACTGTQTCLPDLSGFTECECGDGSTGGDAN